MATFARSEVMNLRQLTLFAEDSHVNRSVTPGSAEARRMTVISGQKCLELFEKLNPGGFLLRTLLESSIWQSNNCLLTWKMKAIGTTLTEKGKNESPHLLFQLRVSMPRISGKGSGLWATPTAADAVGSHGGGQGRSLRTDIYSWKRGMFLTLTARDYRSPNKNGNFKDQLPNVFGGQLNPTWAEWLMGFPIGWTDLED